MMYRVMEIYNAAQGEGLFIGQFSTFVRLFGCNLRCSWCDTAYSINRKEWEAAGFVGEPYQLMTAEELVDSIELRNVVLTGGEPTIQPGIVELLDLLVERGKKVTVETNATRVPAEMREKEGWRAVNYVFWSLSPKLTSAHTGSFDRETVEWFLVKCPQMQLKFVIAHRDDIEMMRANLRALKREVSVPIVIQPEGSIIDKGCDKYMMALQTLQGFASMLHKECGWDVRALPQLHTILYGQTRFV